jgi:hypothetical protein
MPTETIQMKIMPLLCLIGVNNKNLIVTGTENSTLPLLVLPIKDLEWSISVFSIFFVYENMNFRFDGKLLYHFGELLRKYQTICKKFPQHAA